MLSREKVSHAYPQLGEFDPAILCESCDNKLGIFDDYAIEVCRDFKTAHQKMAHGTFEMPKTDREKFAKFVVSVLWRASISKRASFQPVDLGPYEAVARDVVFGKVEIKECRAFEIMVQRYESRHMDVSGIYFHPVRNTFRGFNTYGFGIGGFRIITKVDNRRFPEGYSPMIINRSDSFRGIFIEFEKSSEFQSIVDIMKANDRRPRPFE